MMREKLQHEVGEIIRLLVDRQFDKIAALTNGVRLPAKQMQSAVEQYGRTLVVPPSDAFELMDVVEVREKQPSQWSITMPLWTKEEGRSDLSIEVTIVQGTDKFHIELDDIHVL